MKLTVRCLVLSAVAIVALSASTKVKTLKSDKSVRSMVESVQSSLKRAATVGIAVGTKNASQKMQLNILRLLHEFVKTLQGLNMRQAVTKFQQVEDTIARDKKAVEILGGMMRLATKSETLDDYRETLRNLSIAEKHATSAKRTPKSKTELAAKLRTEVDDHVNFLRKAVDAAVADTLAGMSEIGSTPSTVTSSSSSTPANDNFKHDTFRLPQLFIHMPIWPARLESFYRFRRQNDDVSDNEIADEDFGGDAFDSPDIGGGVAGLIGSLSGGGDGGSDVGALVGAISGLVTTLFGPGGLDVPSLIGTGTSLIAGLLSGDENFGKVLGSYIGLAVEGLSGGGGADNNGAFFGNFVGTLFAQLSADPEEDDVPPKPKIFVDSFFKGIEQSKQKRGTDETNTSGNRKNYIFEFLSNILSSVVGGVTNLVLNASFGSSGGSSNGVADLSAGSSQGSHTGSAYASQSSAAASMPSHTNAKPQ